VAKRILIYPFALTDDFRGTVIADWEREPQKVFLEVETPAGKLEILIKHLKRKLSIEVKPPDERMGSALKDGENELKRELEEAGYELIYFSVKPKEDQWNREKEELFNRIAEAGVNLSA
jgi:hypothetical protein